MKIPHGSRNGGSLHTSLAIALLLAMVSMFHAGIASAQDITIIKIAAVSNTTSNVDISKTLKNGDTYYIQTAFRCSGFLTNVSWSNRVLLDTNVLFQYATNNNAGNDTDVTFTYPTPYVLTNRLRISPTGSIFAANGGTGVVKVISSSGELQFKVDFGNAVEEENENENTKKCILNGSQWTATTTRAWIVIDGTNQGVNNGAIKYHVKSNTGKLRRGHIVVAGRTNTITQTASVKAITDYDGDGRSDLAVYFPRTGAWSIWSVAKNAIVAADYKWGYWGAIPVPGDYDGDETADLAIYDQATGAWFIKSLSKTNALAWNKKWGYPGTVPVPGDYDGDGYSDLAVYDPVTTAWYIRSTKNDANLIWNFKLGYRGTEPVPGDYDGDACTDIAVYDPQTTAWFVWSVAKHTNLFANKWGYWGADVVSADYNNDGRTERAEYELKTGLWHILFPTSSTNTLSGKKSYQWGYAGTHGVVGDYNGDGQSDLAVYHDDGHWFIYSLPTNVLVWNKVWGSRDAIAIRPGMVNPAIDRWRATVIDQSSVFRITGVTMTDRIHDAGVTASNDGSYLLEPGWYAVKAGYYGEHYSYSNGLVKYTAVGTATNNFHVAFQATRTFALSSGQFSNQPAYFTPPTLILK